MFSAHLTGKTNNRTSLREANTMTENKKPHETLTDKNNNLSSAQEVEYANDFKKADKATEDQATDEKNDGKDEEK